MMLCRVLAALWRNGKIERLFDAELQPRMNTNQERVQCSVFQYSVVGPEESPPAVQRNNGDVKRLGRENVEP